MESGRSRQGRTGPSFLIGRKFFCVREIRPQIGFVRSDSLGVFFDTMSGVNHPAIQHDWVRFADSAPAGVARNWVRFAGFGTTEIGFVSRQGRDFERSRRRFPNRRKILLNHEIRQKIGFVR
jgi:hypothetical protein